RELTGVAQDRHTAHARRELLNKLEPFATDYKFELQESGHVPVWPRALLPPTATITSDASATNSAAYFLYLLTSPPPQRYPMRILASLVQPNSCSRSWNAAA